MKLLVNKHPLIVRWNHWINFPVLAVMVWSGLLIYWANDIFRIGIGRFTLLSMKLPDSIYDKLHLSHGLATGMAWHFAFAWIFAVNGIIYVLYTIISWEWRHLWPDRHSFRDAIDVIRHDLGLIKTAPPQEKYNGAQRIAYSAIVVMGLGSILTGLAIYKPVQLGWLTALFFGYAGARFLHFWLTMGYVAFFIVHIAQVARAGWGNFRGMITGYEVADRPAATDGGGT
ncbi:MAG: cytochrome b/b6 domain-containing protein [Capsulimonadaceae bacterium]|nr:cytochrome b/b6 domain-containing protein [Capsulimonadaceae bacterium]